VAELQRRWARSISRASIGLKDRLSNGCRNKILGHRDVPLAEIRRDTVILVTRDPDMQDLPRFVLEAYGSRRTAL